MANAKRHASKKSKPTKKPSKKKAVNPDPNHFVDACAHDYSLALMPSPTHQMLSDINAQLIALESKVGIVDSEWRKEVAAVWSYLKGFASGAQLHALTERVSLIEKHMDRVRKVLLLADEEK
ncbi:hypothetical protein CJ030_MR0G013668 [Morella rubra]|uniref:Uncharacterized protein n=1 Tax=Morella rubra TaxID=262757 RepID=A0A6A1UHQ6_9ROSI|nr:hypothetical protein CJ030_MR0G013668 [Morella rubra]